MSFAFQTRLPLSRHEVDRDHTRRTSPTLLADLTSDPRTRVLPVWHGKALVDRSSNGVHLVLASTDVLTPGSVFVYLGLSLATDAPEPAGTPLLTVAVTDAAANAIEPDETRWEGLRELATVASDRDTGILTEAIAILNWHASHQNCPRCGAATIVEDGGWTRRCPVDGSQIFPRTDPAIIVLVTDSNDRILLGSNAMWENNRYSLLAGFVEPGESLEAAVLREMHEESGLRVTDPVYLGSQPWPFPASIMLGFTARLADDQDGRDMIPDGEEILDLRWFSRDELLSSLDSIILPGRSSIARAMVENWLGERLDHDAQPEVLRR
jgi:NAD+ diphosphatase